MQDKIEFVLDGEIQQIAFSDQLGPTTTVLNFLRSNPIHKGVKEGCAEGDCGACTVVLGELNPSGKISYKAVDSCLIFLPMLQGKQLITIENLAKQTNGNIELHPVQKAMVDCNGSQCGFCTPGFTMSMFALYKSENEPSREVIEDTLTGNLCRCTGYEPIIQATKDSCVHNGDDHFTTDEAVIIGLLNEIARREQKQITTATQKYYQPTTKSEALQLRYRNPEALLVNGGTDIALRVTKRNEVLKEIIDLSNVGDLKKCAVTGYTVKFGAGMSLEAVKDVALEELPALHEALAVFGSKQIRSLATLGGNLGSASPIGDTLPILMAYNAEIKVQNLSGDRKINMNDFVLDYRKTALKRDELISSVIVPKPDEQTKIRFYKVSKRKDLDISTVSAGFSVKLDSGIVYSITLAYGGMAALTKRANNAEDFLIGKAWTRENIEEAMELIAHEFTPISDARSGADFRKLAAKNLLMKFWLETTEK